MPSTSPGPCSRTLIGAIGVASSGAASLTPMLALARAGKPSPSVSALPSATASPRRAHGRNWYETAVTPTSGSAMRPPSQCRHRLEHLDHLHALRVRGELLLGVPVRLR